MILLPRIVAIVALNYYKFHLGVRYEALCSMHKKL